MSLATFSLKNIQGTYFWGLEETQKAGWVDLLANTYKTTQPHEIHKWLGGAPAMKEWRGERVRDKLGDYDLTVISEKFESTLPFELDDWRREKTGQSLLRVREMGQKAGTLEQRLFTSLLNSNSGAGPTAYDGSAYFANSHSVGTVDNISTSNIVAPAAPTNAEMSDAIMLSIQQMMGHVDETGDPMNEFARSFMVMVPTNMWAATIGGIGDTFSAAGVSNTLAGLVARGLSITPVINPRLSDTAKFLTFRTDAPVKAGIWQEEDLGPESFKTLGADSDNAFWRDEIVFGAKRIAQAAMGRYELANRHDFT
tara:strand:+ start:8441 stop:9373 length:933 start_codon:yes stop_codon:yes gene_type:complete